MKTHMLKILLTACCIAAVMPSCRKQGCTDKRATNYDPKATDDDGSCHILGCKDRKADNYSSSVTEDNGSCTYPGTMQFYTDNLLNSGVYIDIFVDDVFVGKLQSTCQASGIDCSTNCTYVLVDEIETGTHSYHAWEIRQVAQNSYDTLIAYPSTNIYMNSKDCIAIVF